MSDNDPTTTGTTASETGSKSSTDAPKSFNDFFNPKAQAKRQAEALEQQKKAAAAAANEATTSASTTSSKPPGNASSSSSSSMTDLEKEYEEDIISWNTVDGDLNGGDAEGKAQAAAELAEQKQQVRDRMPWTEKYRPETLSDVISHQSILSTLDSLLSKGALPHVLFYGPAGSGKTSTALALAKRLCAIESGSTANVKRMVLELNASDERGKPCLSTNHYYNSHGLCYMLLLPFS